LLRHLRVNALPPSGHRAIQRRGLKHRDDKTAVVSVTDVQSVGLGSMPLQGRSRKAIPGDFDKLRPEPFSAINVRGLVNLDPKPTTRRVHAQQGQPLHEGTDHGRVAVPERDSFAAIVWLALGSLCPIQADSDQEQFLIT